MSWTWALPLDRRHAESLAPLRLRAGLEVLDAGDAIWLRGRELDEALRRDLRKVPSAVLHKVLERGRLLCDGSRIPSGSLPSGSWIGLAAWIRPAAPTAAFPGLPPRRLSARLVRSDREEDPGALACGLESWVRFAASAAAVRLRGLAFALRSDGRVLVLAADTRVVLPPIPGTRLVARRGVAWPCGFEWSPPVDGSVLAELLELSEGDVAVFSGDGGLEVIPASAFVHASRSAARLSLEEASTYPGGGP